jgi:eukaryotic-like serine/threonine-protein kinase
MSMCDSVDAPLWRHWRGRQIEGRIEMTGQNDAGSEGGMLNDDELDELVARYATLRPLAETDDLATEFLMRRGALADRLAKKRSKMLLDNRPACFTIGHHRIIEPIHAGATYEVFKAQNIFLGRVDAVKVMRRTNNTPRAVETHLRKLRVCVRVQSSLFVNMVDAGFHRGVHFAIAEYLPSLNLGAFVRSHGPLTQNVAAAIIAHVAVAVSALHSRGFVYGALRPSKVLIEKTGNVKLCDIGIAERPGMSHVLLHAVGSLLDYMAPEAVTKKTVTALSDVYSLGCILYYAVTGRVPFPGRTGRARHVAHQNQLPYDPKALRNDLDDDFVRLIADLMAKEPHDRVQSMSEVTARLTPWLPLGNWKTQLENGSNWKTGQNV